MVFQNNVLSGAGGSGTTTYAIGQSIRINDDDNAYLSRTLSTASDGGKTYTFSWWQKLGSKFGAQAQYTIHTDLAGGNPADYLYFYNDNFYSWHGTNSFITDRKFRDPSAWYHFVYVYDSTQAVASERLRLYVNGIRETSFSTENYPSLNATSYFNTNTAHYIGGANTSSSRLDAYMAEIHFLDGLAYDPSFFGEFNDSGIWIPKEYTGSYGSNGFKIDGRDSSDLGDDESGNGNDFTSNNLTASDQVLDSPTNNFCTYNSIQLQSGATLSAGNLDAVSSGSSWRNVHSTIGVSSGKWYWEVKADVIDSTQAWIAGIQETSFESKSNYWWQSGYTATSSGIVFGVLQDNYKVTNTTRTSFTHDIAQGDIVQFQLNLDDNELTVLVDGVSKGKIYDITADTEYTPAVCLYNTSSATINFGQEGTFGGTETAGGNSDANGVGNFKYSVPSGYLALCTKNLGS